MPRTVDVPLADLLLDQQNARLGAEQPSQPATALALARQQGRRLVKLAASVVERGLDPAQLPTVLATSDKHRRYTVLEGNRRVLAVKALETPTIVSGALQPVDYRRLLSLATKFALNPIESVRCVLFDASEAAEAYEWVLLRHTGMQDGVGLVEWDSDEKDRFAARHGDGRGRGPAGQVLDFLTAVDGASTSRTKVATTLDRLLTTSEVRDKLGIEKIDGELVSWYPKDEVAKGLRKIVEDLRSQTIKVPDVYTADQRQKYIAKFRRTELPAKSSRLGAPVKLADLPSGSAKPVAPRPKPKSRAKPATARTTVASSTAKINPGPPRINAVYNELIGLSADSFPNAGSVLLRVFLELSVDDYIDRHKLMTDTQKRNTVLAKRLKAVADHLNQAGKINASLKAAVHKVADSQQTIAASVTAFHQYVHNPYVHPKPSELRTSWDELQPLLEQVWA